MQSRRLHFVAHRFFSNHPQGGPENTLPALSLADQAFDHAEKKWGAAINRGYEFDVQKTRDGKLVVFHDDKNVNYPGITHKLGRTTDIQTIFPEKPATTTIPDLTWEEVQQLDASHGVAGFNNVRVPLFTEILETVHPRALLDIEIKRMHDTQVSDGMEELVLDTLEARRVKARCFISSFDAGFLQRFSDLTRQRSLDAQYPVGLIAWAKDRERLPEIYARLSPQHLALQIHDRMHEDIAQAHQRGISVLIWNNPQIDTAHEIATVIEAGADGIISNNPGILSDLPEAIAAPFLMNP